MEQPSDRVDEQMLSREIEIARKGRTARVLESYAESIERQEGVCVDSDLPYILRRAALLLRQYCPETKEYEDRMRQLRRMV